MGKYLIVALSILFSFVSTTTEAKQTREPHSYLGAVPVAPPAHRAGGFPGYQPTGARISHHHNAAPRVRSHKRRAKITNKRTGPTVVISHTPSALLRAIIARHEQATPPEEAPAPIRIVEALADAAALPVLRIIDVLERTPSATIEAREYLIKTAHAGSTMHFLGTRLALACINPEFAVSLAGAIKDARSQGMNAGVSSACRPPILRVGGMRDKTESMHSAGMAVDMDGIGRPGSRLAAKWYKIAAQHGIIRPYSASWEWNHMQPTKVRTTTQAGVRRLITPEGPSNYATMWAKQKKLILSVGEALRYNPSRVAMNVRRQAVKHRRHT